MRAVARAELGAPVARYLTKRTRLLAAAGNTPSSAERAWPTARRSAKVRAAFAVLIAMNGGARRCMYCEHDRGTDIDHFNPRANAPALTFSWTNWVLACGECNGRKRHHFPPGLLDPTAPHYQPDLHLEFLPANGAFNLKTPEARASEPVFGLNEGELQRSRHRMFIVYQSVIRHFADAKVLSDEAEAAFFERAARTGPHPSILATIQRWHGGPKRGALHPSCAAAMDAWPEILSW